MEQKNDVSNHFIIKLINNYAISELLSFCIPREKYWQEV